MTSSLTALEVALLVLHGTCAVVVLRLLLFPPPVRPDARGLVHAPSSRVRRRPVADPRPAPARQTPPALHPPARPPVVVLGTGDEQVLARAAAERQLAGMAHLGPPVPPLPNASLPPGTAVVVASADQRTARRALLAAARESGAALLLARSARAERDDAR